MRWVAVSIAVLAVSLVSLSQTLVVARVGDIETLDPAWAYDKASGEAIFNIYETLVFYDGEAVDKFVPMLAKSWTVSPDGLVYTFTIRQGIKFHAGGDLTPEDVVYSLQRALIQDRAGGPVWMLLEPILGDSSVYWLAEDLGSDEAVFQALQRTIRAQGDQVTITLDHPFAPFIQILAGTWASIVDKEWVIAQGGWDGTANWRPWHDPDAAASELFDKANGTGPFKLERWVPGVEISLVRNENYWRERARLDRVIIQVGTAWAVRLAMFEAGQADIIDVPRQYVAQMDNLVAQGRARMIGPLPSLLCQTGFFNFYVTRGSPFMPLLGGEPKPDLLSDLHLRRAINYAFDIDTYINVAWLGEAEQVPGVIPPGRLGYDTNLPAYGYELYLAEQELRQAWGGELWKNGFRLVIVCNQGNEARQLAANLLKQALESFNAPRQRQGLRSPFVVEVEELPWRDYLRYMDSGMLPLFFMGWVEDYAHPHSWVQPYMQRSGFFAMNQHFNVVSAALVRPRYVDWSRPETYWNLQELFDYFILWASRTTDPAQAERLYLELNWLAHEYAINVGHIQLTFRHYEQPWVQGWYYNPAFPGTYFYVLSKT